MQLLVHAAEFMTHYPEKISLPISSTQLTAFSQKCQTYAKALRFKELEFVSLFPLESKLNGEVWACLGAHLASILSFQRMDPVPATPALLEISEDLVKLAQQLQQDELADGVIQILQNESDFKDIAKTAAWFACVAHMYAVKSFIFLLHRYEKNGEWDKALQAYQQEITKPTGASRLLELNCLEQTQKWDQLLALAADTWKNVCGTHVAIFLNELRYVVDGDDGKGQI